MTDVLLLTATQNIPQRGHCESVESDKRGNFLVILEQIAKHDPIEKKEMEGMLHAQVIPQQKEILGCLAEMVQHNIIQEVKEIFQKYILKMLIV